jgi:hypothetical protein
VGGGGACKCENEYCHPEREILNFYGAYRNLSKESIQPAYEA